MGSDISDYLGDPRTCALYLSDAFETCRIDEITAALDDVRRANGSRLRSLSGASEIRLVEVLDILDGAGIRLTAVQKRQAQAMQVE